MIGSGAGRNEGSNGVCVATVPVAASQHSWTAPSLPQSGVTLGYFLQSWYVAPLFTDTKLVKNNSSRAKRTHRMPLNSALDANCPQHFAPNPNFQHSADFWSSFTLPLFKRRVNDNQVKVEPLDLPKYNARA
jgi:hypothetical protein